MDKVWILTEQYNDYDQHGQYFVAAFSKKPTVRDLASFFKMDGKTNVVGGPIAALDFLLHVEAGGGRRGTEDHWYNLDLVECGKRL